MVGVCWLDRSGRWPFRPFIFVLDLGALRTGALTEERLEAVCGRRFDAFALVAAVNGHAMADRARTKLIVLDTSPYSSKLCDTVAFAEPAAGGDAQN